MHSGADESGSKAAGWHEDNQYHPNEFQHKQKHLSKFLCIQFHSHPTLCHQKRGIYPYLGIHCARIVPKAPQAQEEKQLPLNVIP